MQSRWGAIGLGWCNLRWISLGVISLGGSVFGGVRSVWGDVIFGGSVFGGDVISVVVRDIWRRGAGVRSVTLSSLSLSLHIWDPEMVWSENKNVNQFLSQSHKTHDQSKCFSRKFYFPCATEHTVSCKIISWNGFTPKQTQPKRNFFKKNYIKKNY